MYETQTNVSSGVNVYLSGPITGEGYDTVTDWRKETSDVLAGYGITALSPLRHKHYLAGETEIAPSYEEHTMSKQKSITNRDRWDVMRSDVVFVNLLNTNRISIGTVMEIAWADAFRKPIVLVMEQDGMHSHPLLEEVCAFHIETLEEGIEVLKGLLVP